MQKKIANWKNQQMTSMREMMVNFETELDRFTNELSTNNNTDTQIKDYDEQIKQHKQNMVKFPKSATLYQACIAQLQKEREEAIAASKKMPN